MQMSPIWRSILCQLETTLGVWGNFNVKPCSNNAFPSPLALRGFQQMVQRAHFPPSAFHLYWLQNILLWSLMPSQKSLETRSAVPCGVLGSRVVAAQWPGVQTRKPFCPSPELRMGFCCRVLRGCAWGGPHPLNLLHRWNVRVLGNMSCSLVLLSAPVWGENCEENYSCGAQFLSKSHTLWNHITITTP